MGTGTAHATTQATVRTANGYRFTCVTDAPAGSIDWQPAGPLTRDVWVRVYVQAPSSDCGGDISTVYNGWSPSGWAAEWEPGYFHGSGDGATDQASGWGMPVSWSAGATIAVSVRDYGPCTDVDCPDSNGTYALSSGFGGLPAWATDGTAPSSGGGSTTTTTAPTTTTTAGGGGGGGTTTTPSGQAVQLISGSASSATDTLRSIAVTVLPLGAVVVVLFMAWRHARRFIG